MVVTPHFGSGDHAASPLLDLRIFEPITAGPEFLVFVADRNSLPQSMRRRSGFFRKEACASRGCTAAARPARPSPSAVRPHRCGHRRVERNRGDNATRGRSIADSRPARDHDDEWRTAIGSCDAQVRLATYATPVSVRGRCRRRQAKHSPSMLHVSAKACDPPTAAKNFGVASHPALLVRTTPKCTHPDSRSVCSKFRAPPLIVNSFQRFTMVV